MQRNCVFYQRHVRRKPVEKTSKIAYFRGPTEKISRGRAFGLAGPQPHEMRPRSFNHLIAPSVYRR